MSGLVTLYSLPVSQHSYEAIRNFCEDYDIEDVPSRENMFIEVLVKSGVHPNVNRKLDVTFLMNDLELDVVDAVSGSGKVLILSGTSPDLEKFIYDILEGEEDNELVDMEEGPLLGVVISSNFDDSSSYDIDHLSIRISDYLEDIVYFEELETRYYNIDELLDYVYDGLEPEED